MPQYEISFRAEVLYSVIVEADNEDAAVSQAYDEIEDDYEVDFYVESIIPQEDE